MLRIAGRRIIGFIHFPRVLALCEMQSASSRIWTRVIVSISYDNNHYITVHPQEKICTWLKVERFYTHDKHSGSWVFHAPFYAFCIPHAFSNSWFKKGLASIVRGCQHSKCQWLLIPFICILLLTDWLAQEFLLCWVFEKKRMAGF